MERPVVFMISITVLYSFLWIILFTLSRGSESFDQNQISNQKFENLIPKVYHSVIPLQPRSTSYKSLETTRFDLSEVDYSSFNPSLLSLEFSVFSAGSVTFELRNQNFFHSTSQIILIPSEKSSGFHCKVSNSAGLVPPESSSTLGPILCESSRNGSFSFQVLIIADGKIIDLVQVEAKVAGPMLEIKNVAKESELHHEKFQIKNVGESSIMIQRILFNDFSCFENDLEIIHCSNEFLLNPESGSFFEISKSKNTSKFKFDISVIVLTSAGLLMFPLTVIFHDSSQEDPQVRLCFVFLVTFCIFYFFSMKFQRKVEIISGLPCEKDSEVEEMSEKKDLKRYSKLVFAEKVKSAPSSLKIFKQSNISDQFTMTSETTDTHLNSPTNSLNSEDLSEDEDYFLDSYKMTGLFSMNACRGCFNSNS
jgi:hypothetical protein